MQAIYAIDNSPRKGRQVTRNVTMPASRAAELLAALRAAHRAVGDALEHATSFVALEPTTRKAAKKGKARR